MEVMVAVERAAKEAIVVMELEVKRVRARDADTNGCDKNSQGGQSLGNVSGGG